LAGLRGIEAISFDLFETLIDWEIEKLPVIEWQGRSLPSTAGVVHRHLAERHDVSLERMLEVMREVDERLKQPRMEAGREFTNDERFEAVVAALGLEDPGLAAELGQLHMDLIRSHTAMPAHHGEVVERLARRFRLALCSNFTHSPTAVRILEERGLRARFEVIVISDAVDSRKPARPIFDAVRERIGVEPSAILHVGDRLRADVAGAAARGMRTAWITRCVRDRAEALARYDGPAPDLEVADLAELEPLLL